MKVKGINVNFKYVDIFFEESFEYVIDARQIHCINAPKVSEWLDNIGISRDQYIILDAYTGPSSHLYIKGHSRVLLEFSNMEPAVYLKTMFSEYKSSFRNRGIQNVINTYGS